MAQSKNSTLNCDEICRIMEACAKNGVLTLQFKDLHLQFGKPTKTSTEKIQSPVTGLEVVLKTPEPPKQVTLEDEEIAAKEERIAMATIENPLEAEELLMQGELVDDEEPNSDERNQ